MQQLIPYLAILAGYLVLLFASAREPLPEGTAQLSFLLRIFQKAAARLYRRSHRFGRGRDGGRRRAFGGLGDQDTAGKDLQALDPSKGGEERYRDYRVEKLRDLLIFGFLASFLGLAATVGTQPTGIVGGRYILREGYGGAAKEITATAVPEQHSAEGVQQEDAAAMLGEYVIHVDPQKYSKAQTDAMAEEVFQRLPALILGGNADLTHVRGNLSLVHSVDGAPFLIHWESSDYGCIDSNGIVYNADAAASDGERHVTLTATLRYQDASYEHSYEVTVLSPIETDAERISRLIQEALDEQEAASAEEKTLTLPDEVDGMRLSWAEPESQSGLVIFALALAAGLINFMLSDQRLHAKAQARELEMKLDYPQVISKIVLFLGAGMSVRNVFYKLGRNYEEQRRKGGEKRYAYEEILLVCHEFDSGVSEYGALAHFGMRCGLRQYTKLCSLLSQSLKKGNSELLRSLQEEVEDAYEERRQLARQLGEEAGTKLLAPMIMMLVVTLVIIIIPAFYGFAV
jgi:tight adherence protein C